MKVPLDSVGGYRMERYVARGGMGVVYRALQPQLSRFVALKLIAPEGGGDAAMAARFKQEALLSAAVEHPNVIPVYDAGDENGWLFIAMRFVEGSDLAAHLKRQQRLHVDDAVGLTAQVADGLQAAHDRGVVHRDVKPSNVLLASNGRPHPYLTDFGLARSLAGPDERTPEGGWVGTAAYMAPEQVWQSDVDVRADVYALGCVLYQLLAGHCPFERDTTLALLFAHVHDDVPSCRQARADVPASLDGVIRRAMAKDPGDRFPSAADFAGAASVATRARPAPLRPAAYRPARPVADVRLEWDAVEFGSNLSISFHRTLRVPDDGRPHPAPPGLGRLPICRVDAYADRVPADWRRHGGVFVPLYQREALWISFGGVPWSPNAVKLGVGMVNAVSGERLDPWMTAGRHDYVVCPAQKRIDGILTGVGRVRQFVAVPLGIGLTVEARATGREEFGGIQVIAYDAKEGLFTQEPGPPVAAQATAREPAPSPRGPRLRGPEEAAGPATTGELPPLELGISAGGEIEQQILSDVYGAETWNDLTPGRVFVHLVNSEVFREITAMDPPPCPVDAGTYAEHGLPWLESYEEQPRIEPGDWSRSP